MSRYNLVFVGKTEVGIPTEEVRDNLARILKIDSKKAERLFNGERHVLKKSLDADKARQYTTFLKKHGVLCVLDPVKGPEKIEALTLVPVEVESSKAENMKGLSLNAQRDHTYAKDRLPEKHDSGNALNQHKGVDAAELSNPQISEGSEQKISFYRSVWSAFLHPLRGQGLLVLFVGTCLFILMSFAMNAPFFLGWFAAIFAFGYMSNYMMDVLLYSASGDERLPGLPGYEDFFTSALQPLLLVGGSAAFCFLPAIVVYNHDSLPASLLGGAIFLGALLLPASLIQIASTQSLMCLNPIAMVRIIAATFKDYFFVVLVLFGIVAASVMVDLPASLLGAVAGVFIQLYLLVVAMKIIGLICYCNSENL